MFYFRSSKNCFGASHFINGGDFSIKGNPVSQDVQLQMGELACLLLTNLAYWELAHASYYYITKITECQHTIVSEDRVQLGVFYITPKIF